ncbi:MAG: transporter [Pseudomonadota bacterium]
MRKTFMFAAACCAANLAHGQAPPSVGQPQGINLGGTSFFDGITGTEPGWAYLATLRYGSANAIKDNTGTDLPFFNRPKIRATTLVNQFSYTSATRIGNGTLGFNALLPTVHLDGSFAQPGAVLQGGGTALGDLIAGPVLQFDMMPGPTGHPMFVHRLEFDVIFPTGRHDRQSDLNQGSGAYAVNPYWAATLFLGPQWEVSWRLHYLYNFKNTDPASSTPTAWQGRPVTDTQAGQAAWINFAASYAITRHLHLGLNGYYFKQVSDSKANGADMAGSREQVLGLGPGLMLEIDQQGGKKDVLWLNTYTESEVRNRARSRLVLQARYVHTF